MKVLDFIRFNADWETKLVQAPYHIKAVWDGDYVLLRYSQLESDFNEPIVRECRGCIFYIPNGDNGSADVVCYPFDKFGNYGESYVPELDWSTARVTEKVDGSLIKMWNHKGEWHISTNNTIDAHNAQTSVEGITFYDMVMRALEKNGNPQKFFEALQPTLTYMFELVSPETRVTIAYPEAKLYYLGARSMCTHKEIDYAPLMSEAYVEFPKVYKLTTLNDCIEAANLMTKDEEGFVVCDAQFNRVKVKSPEYLIASKLRNNNAITVRNVLSMIREEKIDDFLAYAPDYKDFVEDIQRALRTIALAISHDATLAEQIAASYGKPFHEVVLTQLPEKSRDYAFKLHTGKVTSAMDYLLYVVTLGNLVEWVKECLDKIK